MKIKFQSSRLSVKKKLLISVLCLGLCFCLFAFYTYDDAVVPRSELQLQSVKQGNIDIYIDVFGELISAQEQLVTAPAAGNVTQILAYPGSQVDKGTVILRLANPKLEQDLRAAKAKVAQMKSQREALTFEQENERLNFQSRIEEIKSELEKAKLEKSVQGKLRELGVASLIELQRASLNVKHYAQKLEFEQQRFVHFIAMQKHQSKQMDINLNQQYDVADTLTQQLQQLNVTAEMDGALQAINVELGESVQSGQVLAKVGSDSELIARLRLPRNQADQIDLNAPVIIDTQKGTMKARIRRIESIVTNNSVRADATIEGNLASNARPSLTISAKVFVQKQADTLYINQVFGLTPNSQQDVYVLHGDNQLHKTKVTLGPLSLGKLVIKEGIEAGDRLAHIDTTKYKQFEQLAIVN